LLRLKRHPKPLGDFFIWRAVTGNMNPMINGGVTLHSN
jgi:hypothetical protein